MSTDNKKRKTLTFVAGLIAGGGMVGVAIPFIGSFKPTDKRLNREIDIDISKLKEGQMLAVPFVSGSIYILKRSKSELEKRRC